MNITLAKNKLAVLSFSLCLVALTACQLQQGNDQNKPEDKSPALPGGYPANPTGNVWSPDREEQVPYYEVPAGWESNPSSKWSLKNNVPGQETSYLSLEYPGIQSSPEAARDAAYDQAVCENGVNQNAFINCQEPPRKALVTLSGQTVYQLTYRGSWRGENRPVREFYFLSDDQVYSLKVEGEAADALAAVEQIIATLTFRSEIFVPGSNPAEYGGI